MPSRQRSAALALALMAIAALILTACGSTAPSTESKPKVARQYCASPRACVQLAMQQGYVGHESLKVPSTNSLTFSKGWILSAGHPEKTWVFNFAYIDKGTGDWLQESAFPGFRLDKPCPTGTSIGGPAVSPNGQRVCFIISQPTGDSFVTFHDSDISYQINVAVAPEVTTAAQRAILLAVVNQLQQQPGV